MLIHVPGISILMDKYMYVNRLNLNMHSSLWVMDVRLLLGMTIAENFETCYQFFSINKLFFQSINCKIIRRKTVYVHFVRKDICVLLKRGLFHSITKLPLSVKYTQYIR